MTNQIKVLMVDDDKMLLDMYSERLELAGFKVDTSSNGEECLAKIHQVKPDIILLDIMMPKVNGYETLASIKSDPETKDIPVIILSALVRDINKGRAIEAGADDYIIKSEVMPADVIKKIEGVLQKYHKDIKVDEPPTTQTPSVPASDPPQSTESPASAKATADKPPPASAPAKTVERPANPPQEIQFEPQKPTPETNTAPQPAVTMPVKSPQPAVVNNSPDNSQGRVKKTSPLILFFLVLIVLLIIASDFFFYLKFRG